MMLGMRQRGKKPVAILVIWLIWWFWRDFNADTVLQQIDYALSFIGLTLWLAILAWFVDSQKPVAPEDLSNTVVKSQRSNWADSDDRNDAKP